MKETLNRLNDVFFKYLLNDTKKKSLTLSFINGILDYPEDNCFIDLDFIDTKDISIAPGKSIPLLHVCARKRNNVQVYVEVHIYLEPNTKKRFLYYWSKTYGNELQKEDSCKKLIPVISINLMDFNAFPEYTTCHHSYHVYNDETHDRLLDDLEMHFIELEKIHIGDIRKLKKSEQWIAYFSNQCNDEEREVLAMSEPAIKEAMKCELYFTQDEKLRRKYEIQEKARRDYLSMLDNIEDSHQRGLEEGRKEGIEEGRKEGIEEGRKEGRREGLEEGLKMGARQERAKMAQENVLAMIREGLPLDMISRITGLSTKKIQEITEKDE